jgi:hypothetical protein
VWNAAFLQHENGQKTQVLYIEDMPARPAQTKRPP